MIKETRSSGSVVPFQHFFGILGYSIFCLVVLAALFEFFAFSFWSIRQALQRDNPHENMVNRNPPYDSQPWAKEIMKEEWRGLRGLHEYVPFRVWGLTERHGPYINVDKTDLGFVRRTINPARKECVGKPHTKVWVFGGSTVFGMGAPDWGTLPSYLSATFDGSDKSCVEVSNLGVEAYVSTQEMILLMEKLKAGFRPNVVIFYDGWNDSMMGGISPGDPTGHFVQERIKLSVENGWRSRLIFLNDLYSVRLVRGLLNRFRSKQPLHLSDEEISKRATATLANYEGNLRIIEAVANAYGFKTYFFWQPSLFYGSKPTGPFEQELIQMRGQVYARAMMAVYQEAERRSASTGSFVFLGRVFDEVKEPLYLDGGMHLCPLGNQIVALAIARTIEDGGLKVGR